MSDILSNGILVLAAVAVLGYVAFGVYTFFSQPAEKQMEQVREWLLWAVTEAEMDLGGGTGALKLRSVYDAFVQRFPAVARVITFTMFAEMVDDALEWMREFLSKNEAARKLVQGEEG